MPYIKVDGRPHWIPVRLPLKVRVGSIVQSGLDNDKFVVKRIGGLDPNCLVMDVTGHVWDFFLDEAGWRVLEF